MQLMECVYMQDDKKKNIIKTIIKLLVVVPLFYFVGICIGRSYISGNHYIILVLTFLCLVVGKILSKI